MCALEAMALGTPVVSTSSDGMRDITKDGFNGYLTDDDADMARKLLKIINEPEHRKLLSQNTVNLFAQINDSEKYRRAIADCYR